MNTHAHAHDENYFIDQLCTVALAAAFGLICLALYFSHQEMLYRLLGQQFHPFVLGSGIALVLICGVRSMFLWREWRLAKASKAAHAQLEEPCAHKCREHGHAHSHSHSHGHGGAEHEHVWSPWRYAVLFLPIFLFLLGLPSKGPALAPGRPLAVDFTEEALEAAAVAGLGGNGWAQLCSLARSLGDQVEQEPIPADFKRLEAMSSSQADRDYWKGKVIKVKGQYDPVNDRVFWLVRFRVGCCAADAIRLDVPIISREPIHHLKPADWVAVTGRIDFRQLNAETKMAILVSSRQALRPTSPDLNPYEQH